MFPIDESFRRYPLYRTPCPLEGCQEVFQLPHDDTLASLTAAADVTARQCEMHLLYHKVYIPRSLKLICLIQFYQSSSTLSLSWVEFPACRHLGIFPARQVPPIEMMEQAMVAPPLPPRLDENSSATPSPPSPPPPRNKSRRGLEEQMLARANLGTAQLDGMSREELVDMYRQQIIPTKKNNVCGIKRPDIGKACGMPQTR